MRVGFFSPLPPARTGVADYSAALLHYLKPHCRININSDGDVNLYHIGNNQLHAGIYRHALQRPGVVVLHDAILHHFALGYFSEAEYVEEFAYNYGDWNRDLAQRLWRQRVRSGADPEYFRFGLLKRIAERSRAIVVHNPAAARMVREHKPEANVVEIPHLLIPHPTPHPADSERLRSQIGGRLLFGIFGYLRESKRVLPMLRVFKRHPEATLLLAGEMASADLRRAVDQMGSRPNVYRIGYLSDQRYWSLASAVNACLNLRQPAAGETSGVSIGMMGTGVPVVMTDSEENSRFPDGVCLKISAGLSEEAEVDALLDWAKQHRSSLREIGEAGRAYVHHVHAGESVAESFARVLAVH